MFALLVKLIVRKLIPTAGILGEAETVPHETSSFTGLNDVLRKTLLWEPDQTPDRFTPFANSNGAKMKPTSVTLRVEWKPTGNNNRYLGPQAFLVCFTFY